MSGEVHMYMYVIYFVLPQCLKLPRLSTYFEYVTRAVVKYVDHNCFIYILSLPSIACLLV